MFISGKPESQSAQKTGRYLIIGLYFIFYATEDTTKRPWLWLAVEASGVVLSHIISVLIVTIAVVIPFIALLIKRHDRFVWSQLIKSLLVILGISLFFLIPFLDYYSMNNLAVTQISAGTSRSAAAQAAVEPGQLFKLFPIFSGLSAPVQAGVSDDLPLTLGWSLISGVLLALFICAHAKWNDKTTRNNILVINLTCIVIAIGILYMSSVFFPWQRTLPLGNRIIALLASIQFPWRLFGAVDALLLIPLCIGFAYLERSKSFHTLGHIVLTALLAFLSNRRCHSNRIIPKPCLSHTTIFHGNIRRWNIRRNERRIPACRHEPRLTR